MAPLTHGYYDNPVTLTCGVDSMVPYELNWFKDDMPLGNTLYYRYTVYSMENVQSVVVSCISYKKKLSDKFNEYFVSFLADFYGASACSACRARYCFGNSIRPSV